MLKKFVSSLMAVMMLTACGTGKTGAEADKTAEDTAKQAERIVKELELSEKVDLLEDRIVQGLFFFEEGAVTESTVYMHNDSSADMVAVFACEDTDSSKKAIREFLDTQKGQMQNYYPDEVFKVDNAVVYETADEIAVIICDDLEKAKTVAAEVLGK